LAETHLPDRAEPGLAPGPATAPSAKPTGKMFAALTMGAVGVVFGDIGTSPIYALREALGHSRRAPAHDAVLGVVSLLLWTLTLIVTVKYILVLMRADNRGEGGPVALMTLAQRGGARATGVLLLLGVTGVALFYADGIITPAFSVLSAVEGLKAAPGMGGMLGPLALPLAAGILVALFLGQVTGTHRVAALFGPITAVWFLVLAALGVYNLIGHAEILQSISPYWAVKFLAENGVVGFVILGSVFLAVTGAEALYADMGQFGKSPVRAAWFALVFPCLALNYLGQGALVLTHPHARSNPFFAMAPHEVYWPVLALATTSAVIASQAVITGAFSMTRQAVQIGVLPRIDAKRTSETQAGQVFMPAVNGLLLAAEMILLAVFQTSHNLASAYGVAVTGTMLISTLLAFAVARRAWRWGWPRTLATLVPIAAVDLVFLSSNLLKVAYGAWDALLPAAYGVGLVIVMWTWSRGMDILNAKTRDDSLPLADVCEMLTRRPPFRTPGTALFLTGSPEVAPVALMHNLKHNKVLHQHNLILTVRTAETPRAPECDRVKVEPINADFSRVTITYGFMESPNVPKALAECEDVQPPFDMMTASFFMGRRTVKPDVRSRMPLWQDQLFMFLMKNATNPTDFFHIPPGRAVELGAQLTI